jgi:hypothetical protein
MTDAMQRLLEHLQTSWRVMGDEIDPEIAQHHLLAWEFAPDQVRLCGEDMERQPLITGDILWFDNYLDWVLCEDGFWWLHTAEEGEKMRYLGG